MTAFEQAPLRQLALQVVTREAGSGADPPTVAAGFRRAYDNLARVLVPFIGEVGAAALTRRAWHLAQREYPWLAHTRDPNQAEEPYAWLGVAFERLDDPLVAAEGAAAVLATLSALLATIIGEPLTSDLLHRAWPDAFSRASAEETRA